MIHKNDTVLPRKGQQIVVYTDHKNLMQDALGLTSDRVTKIELLAILEALKEFKGIL